MDFCKRLRVEPGRKVRLADCDPDDTPGADGKKEARSLLDNNVKRLAELQYLLYAESSRALLIVLQAMDAGGKDGAIRRVMGPMNPQGCEVTSFKGPTAEDLAHDFLWRVHKAVPAKGVIGIFNRSHYEDVLIVRVRDLAPKSVWSKRYGQINAFEKILAQNDVHILKFFLHISAAEQLERLMARLDEPDKHWKATIGDFEERKHWDDYQRAYEEALGRCSTDAAPWFIIPANKKWFRDLAVSQIIVETLEKLDMKFPKAKIDVEELRRAARAAGGQ